MRFLGAVMDKGEWSEIGKGQAVQVTRAGIWM